MSSIHLSIDSVVQGIPCTIEADVWPIDGPGIPEGEVESEWALFKRKGKSHLRWLEAKLTNSSITDIEIDIRSAYYGN